MRFSLNVQKVLTFHWGCHVPNSPVFPSVGVTSLTTQHSQLIEVVSNRQQTFQVQAWPLLFLPNALEKCQIPEVENTILFLSVRTRRVEVVSNIDECQHKGCLFEPKRKRSSPDATSNPRFFFKLS